MNYSIAIVDDHPLFIEGFKSFLRLNEKIEELKTALNGKVFIDMMEDGYKPDIVFMDILMPVLNGIETTKYIKTHFPETKIIALSSLESLEHVELMIDAGVDGYLLKEVSPEEITKAIDAVLNKNNYFSNKVLLSLSKRAIIDHGSNNKRLLNKPLSSREREILVMFCKGYTRPEIAKRFHISERTVDKHKENLLAKTGCKNLIRLVIYSIKNELVNLDSLLTF
ncbi:response regulator transcription factor [Carboxylicivirga sp. RSCT41]|uniref:response regulator transcription factor n=1 Tax=Carboxylicivirga agarovorans TaxID=3417570 RepID=UPI003D339205